MADLKTTAAERAGHNTERVSPMKTLDELDRLHAAATGQRLTPSPVAFEVAATQAWPAFSARLRAAEAEVERLRALSAEARDMLRDMPWRRGGDALVTRLDRAALGEP